MSEGDRKRPIYLFSLIARYPHEPRLRPGCARRACAGYCARASSPLSRPQAAPTRSRDFVIEARGSSTEFANQARASPGELVIGERFIGARTARRKCADDLHVRTDMTDIVEARGSSRGRNQDRVLSHLRRAAASARLRAPSLRRILRTCVLTVVSATCRADAISRSGAPPAMPR